MIPSQNLEEFEPFAESGDKVAPVPAKYAQGYLPGEVFPAQHENYLMGKASRCSEQHRAGIRSMEAELNNIVDAGGAEPDDTDDTQVLTAVQYLINQAKTQLVDQMMPIGFIWTTSAAPNTAGGNPNTLCPGTYGTRIKNGFIYAAGDNDTVDSNPASDTPHGSNTHQISAAELPSHVHNLSISGGNARASNTGAVQEPLTGSVILSKLDAGSQATSGIVDAKVSTSGVYGGSGTNYNQWKVTITATHSHYLTGYTGAGNENTSSKPALANTAYDQRANHYIKYCWERVAPPSA